MQLSFNIQSFDRRRMGIMFPLQIFKDSDTAFERNIWRRDPREFSAPAYLGPEDSRQDFLDRRLALVATCFQYIGGLMSEVTIRVLGIPLPGHVTFGFLQTPKVTNAVLYVFIWSSSLYVLKV